MPVRSTMKSTCAPGSTGLSIFADHSATATPSKPATSCAIAEVHMPWTITQLSRPARREAEPESRIGLRSLMITANEWEGTGSFKVSWWGDEDVGWDICAVVVTDNWA